MNREKRNNSVNHREIVKRRKDSSTTSSTSVARNSETIPVDLIAKILRGLPTKSIAICRCVSKDWNCLLRTPTFTRMFLARSSTQPRLLFTLEVDGKWHFFSSPQPRNMHVSVLEAEYHMSFSGDWYKELCLYVNGFVYLNDKQMIKGKMERVPMICNPSTGQEVFLPKVRAKNTDIRSFFGYEPIKKELKVLCMTVARYRQQTNSREHQVLTVGDGKLLWRKIECWYSHFPEKGINGICINGILYYVARTSMTNMTNVIACFDLKSEKFSFIEIEESSTFTCFLMLINYKRKLGAVVHVYGSVNQLWILDDIKEKIWSKRLFCLPPNIGVIRSIKATDTGEIVWAPSRWNYPFYVNYFNIEKCSIRRVEIKGIKEKVMMGRDRVGALFTFTNHVENVMFLQQIHG